MEVGCANTKALWITEPVVSCDKVQDLRPVSRDLETRGYSLMLMNWESRHSEFVLYDMRSCLLVLFILEPGGDYHQALISLIRRVAPVLRPQWHRVTPLSGGRLPGCKTSTKSSYF